jgi:signal transduction histidine kinase
MKRPSHSPSIAASWIFPVAMIALTSAIFVVDTVTDLEIAVEVFYVAVVLLSVGYFGKRGVMIVSAGCMALTVLSYFLNRTGSFQAGLINGLISLSAIAATTYLVLRIKSAELAVQEARTQLAHMARVTTLGELTTSIAHEVNQPLGAVVASGNACLRWLARQPPNLEKAQKAVERMVNDGKRASEVIGRVRDFAKRAPVEKRWLDINETILEIVTLTHSEVLRNRISLRTQLSDNLPLVFGDRIQLQQVILNLILNAVEAIGVVADGPRELLVSSATNGSDVRFSVCDSGAGLKGVEMDRLFDAFYTTKPDGMGMGLTISHSIIEAHGGRLSVTPNMPRGAIFQVTLPAGDKKP